MSEYVKVPTDKANQIKLGPTGMLVRGHVLHFYDANPNRFNAKAMRERHGRRLRTKLDEQGTGRYWWTEPMEAE